MSDRFLNLILLDSTTVPLARRPYTLVLGSETRVGLTDAEGRVSEPIPAGTLRVDLTIAWRRFVLHLDALEPVTSVKGAQARLNQLNFFAGLVDGDAGPRTRGALRSFAGATGGGHVAEEGELDPTLLARLERRYRGEEALVGGDAALRRTGRSVESAGTAAGPVDASPVDATGPVDASPAGSALDASQTVPKPFGAPQTVAADRPVDVDVLLSDRRDGPAVTLVVYDWFSVTGEFAPQPGNAVEPLVDGAAAWGRVKKDLAAATHDVRVASWMLRPDTELERPKPTALAGPEARAADRFGAVVEALAERGVALRILIWGMTYTPLMNRWLRRWYWGAPPNIDILEHDHPVLIGSNHQKTLTIDGRVGYCGGMNLKENDWDTSEHRPFEPRRMPWRASSEERRAVRDRHRPSRFAPRHDLSLRIEGPAVANIDACFAKRWEAAADQWRRRPGGWLGWLWRRLMSKRLPPATLPALSPPEPPKPPGDTWVQIVRTRAADRGGVFSAPPAEQGILDAYRRAIGNARETIYIENQYFRSRFIGDALYEALERNRDLRIIVVTWPIAEGRPSFNPAGYWTAHTQNRVRQVRPDFRLTRLVSAEPDAEGRVVERVIDVHAKAMIIDDVWLTIGSANINDRGLKFEGEMNAVVLDRTVAGELRRSLMAEHLALQPGDPRLRDGREAFELWDQRLAENEAKLARGELADGHVRPFIQRARLRPPLGVGSGVF